MISKRESRRLELLKNLQAENERRMVLATERQMAKREKQNTFVLKLQIEKEEAEMEKRLAAAQESLNWRKDELEQEEKLAYELSKAKSEDIVFAKRREMLYNCPELRDLEEKLRSAYHLKTLQAQICEKAAKKKEENDRETEERRKLSELSIQSKLDVLKAEMEDHKRKLKYRNELQDQMICNYKVKQAQYLESLKEKILIDDAVRSIREEDEKQAAYNLEIKKRTKEDLDSFREAQKLWLTKEKERFEEEERNIKKYLEHKEARDKSFQEMRDERARLLSCCRDVVTEKLIRAKTETDEREEISAEYLEMEMDKKLRQSEEEKRKREMLAQEDIRRTFVEQTRRRKEEILKEKEAERVYVENLKKQFQEELCKEEKEKIMKREMEVGYRKELAEDIGVRARLRVEESERDLLFYELERRAETERQKLVNEERLKLLREHMEKLLGFIPRGMVKAEEVEHLSPTVQDYYNQKKGSKV